jgi:hypothetical protein
MKIRLTFILPLLFLLLLGLAIVLRLPLLLGILIFLTSPSFVVMDPLLRALHWPQGEVYLLVAGGAVHFSLIGFVLDIFLAKLKTWRASLREWEARTGLE